ncbi:hypothetical protein ACHHYP_15226 [Achlya hypogyna]|uniref:PH domain-containing protein n=1 Tax=Achlya hypogyna TaxID=1202772 RepID=A0A1V9YBC4_ACHHY|nr:hypothetical protein ACHHYP_15226 [Achlya hypogyna]
MIMEGYLLYLDPMDVAVGELVYAALEEGLLKLYTSPDRAQSALRLEIPITDHETRVKCLPYGENGSFVPCRFQLDLSPYEGDGKTQVYVFATASFEATRAWCRALQDWRRHIFDPSFRSLPLAEEDTQWNPVEAATTDCSVLLGRVAECELVPHPQPAPESPCLFQWLKDRLGYN